jgi:hypothetical protein
LNRISLILFSLLRLALSTLSRLRRMDPADNVELGSSDLEETMSGFNESFVHRGLSKLLLCYLKLVIITHLIKNNFNKYNSYYDRK